MTVKHIVLVKVLPGVASTTVEAALNDLRALVGVIPGLLSFSAGSNHSPEAAGRAYTHAFVMEFADIAARDAYLPDPRHQAAAQGLRAIRDPEGGITIVDYTG